MFVRSLVLRNFRNHEERRFEFDPRINVIIGHNARGKTSVLEALYLLMSGRSFRALRTKELIQHEKSHFVVEVYFQKHGIEQKLSMSYSEKERKILYNSTACHALTHLIGILPGTVMTPDDILMVKGPSKLRRRYLDTLLAQPDPLYVHHLSRYQRALLQRNTLLRRGKVAGIEMWEGEMAKSASYLAAKRYAAIQFLDGRGKKLFAALSQGKEQLKLGFKSQCKDHLTNAQQFYSMLYQQMRPREVQRGMTLAGPQRDDLVIHVDGKDSRVFASEGQQKSCITALRFAEWQYLQENTETPPLMLIDDLGVSLDFERRKALMEYIGNFQQVFITTTDLNIIGEKNNINKIIEI